MNFKIPESVTINNRTFHFEDCSSTPEEAVAYLILLEKMQSYDSSIVV